MENYSRLPVFLTLLELLPGPVPSSSSTTLIAAQPAPNLRPEKASLAIALIADDLTLSFESMHNVRQALTKFVDEHMQPGDVVAIRRTSCSNGSLQQFTADKKLLHSAIDRIGWNIAGRGAAALPAIGIEPSKDPRGSERRSKPPRRDPQAVASGLSPEDLML